MLSAKKIKPKNANTITNTPNLGHITLVPPFFPASVVDLGFFSPGFFFKARLVNIGSDERKNGRAQHVLVSFAAVIRVVTQRSSPILITAAKETRFIYEASNFLYLFRIQITLTVCKEGTNTTGLDNVQQINKLEISNFDTK